MSIKKRCASSDNCSLLSQSMECKRQRAIPAANPQAAINLPANYSLIGKANNELLAV